jgi:hypothetical protein
MIDRSSSLMSVLSTLSGSSHSYGANALVSARAGGMVSKNEWWQVGKEGTNWRVRQVPWLRSR